MSKKQATIQDIARELKITASTVSRALNDHPKISKKTKDKVWKTAHELNYQPNTVASNLRKGKGNTVGMIVPRINRHFFSNVITGVESVLNPAGYNLIICQSEEKYQKEVENVETLISNRVSGILISLSIETLNTKHLQKIINSQIPLVMFDRTESKLNISQVVNDDEAGAYEMTCHLLEQGYRDIMWMGGPRTSSIYHNRYLGYKRALEEYKVPIEKMHCFEGPSTLVAALEYMRIFLKNNKLPDVVFATSDYMAMGTIQALQEAGLQVPKDVAVAGYSNEPFAALIDPKLTTIEQFSEEMGRATARLLLDQLLSETDEPVPRKIIIKPKLIIRETTRKRKKSNTFIKK
ncbi:MAG: LacI family DNA-binding transcriptional regulator [Prolixibacteraceae bacterium]|nr:LacI family DNA-binding transcriptional regulator [Prolixibacteraceae bacterium]